MHPQVDDFMVIFDGYREAYGAYTVPKGTKKAETGKIVGRASTINRHLTKEIWDGHLKGDQAIGIIPINRESMCRFAAIDVDVYPVNVKEICLSLLKLSLPLVPCLTKSGGVHLYLFCKDLLPAKLVVAKIKEMAGALGYGGCEIFPKQTIIMPDRGDLGSWINLPYFEAGKTARCAIGPEGQVLTIDRFVKRAYEMMQTEDQLRTLEIHIPETLPGGPPCLQLLVTQGFPNGTRNNGLFNMGVYARKVSPADWEKHVEAYNQRFMDPPLTSEEVLGVIKSLRRKEYTYTCKAQPIQAFCDAAKCRLCEHGIGTGNHGMPKMGSLTKLKTNPPIWFLEVETENGGVRLELSTTDLQSPMGFQARCMEEASIMPHICKRDDWHMLVAALMQDVTEIEVPIEVTPRGQLFHYLEQFCLGRVSAKTPEEILLGKPHVADGMVEFRFSDFLRFLERARYSQIPLNKIAMYIKDIRGVEKGFKNLHGKGVNTWLIPVKIFSSQNEPFKIPDMGENVL